jgi:hypothetical protein
VYLHDASLKIGRSQLGVELVELVDANWVLVELIAYGDY